MEPAACRCRVYAATRMSAVTRRRTNQHSQTFLVTAEQESAVVAAFVTAFDVLVASNAACSAANLDQEEGPELRLCHFPSMGASTRFSTRQGSPQQP